MLIRKGFSALKEQTSSPFVYYFVLTKRYKVKHTISTIYILLFCFSVSISSERNGKHITAYGNVHALFVFIQFDDNYSLESQHWPFDTLALPEWSNKFIDDNIIASGYPNLTQYFDEMSNLKFKLTGKVFPKLVRPKFDQSKYQNIGEVNEEILHSIDIETDFSEFDNWTVKENSQFIDSADGIVDMIYLIYRDFENRLFFNQGWSGSAHLYLPNDIKTNDGVIIKKGQMKSGIQMRGGKHGFHYSKYVAAHEIGHFLFGGGHMEGVTNLALMTGGPVWNASRGMNSWEREKLGWINFTDVQTDNDSTYTLSDYFTTNNVLRLKLSDTEWYLIENRQKISIHDAAGDHGIYIYHVTNNKFGQPRVNVRCADGYWTFKPDAANKKLFKLKPNPIGKSEMNYTMRIQNIHYACYEEIYGNNDAWGDSTDAFDLLYNNVLSPVSNPPSANYSRTPFSIEILEQDQKDFKVRFYFNEVYGGSPSKPQNFNAHTDSSNSVFINMEFKQRTGYCSLPYL
jgi:M6 family metalloprotease-like protein